MLAMLLTGTFAWANFNQSKTNEFSGSPDNGGTLHDDFCQPKKDVYIENWGGSVLFVRIRLDEYMELGDGAGLKGAQDATTGTWTANPANHATSLMPGASINDKRTWQPHIPDGSPNICTSEADFHGYWTWGMGGSKLYLPAPTAGRQDPAYVDSNTNAVDPANPNARMTLDATVLTMAQWIAMGSPIGPYWVIDADGWAYWAQPLQPDTATGLLLNSVTLLHTPEESYYYAINVIAQMATKDGDGDYTDFFNNSDPDHTATNDGEGLLNKIVDGAASVKFNSGTPASVKVGETVSSPSVIVGPAGAAQSPLTWTSGNPSLATVDSNGVVTGVKAGGPVIITVTAPNGAKSGYSIVVTQNGSTEVPATGVSINGGDKALDIGETYTPGCTAEPSDSTDTPLWSSGDASVATVDPNTGKITAVGEGTALITVTAGGKSDSITVTVSKPTDPELPLSGGPGAVYEPEVNGSTDTTNFALWLDCADRNHFDKAQILKNGYIKLKDVLAPSITDYTGFSVTANDASMDGTVAIGQDNTGDMAIIYTYYPPVEAWNAAVPGYPTVSTSLTLTKAGYSPTAINVNLRYDGSLVG